MAQKGLFDRNILIIFGFIILLALAVLIFRFATQKKCPNVSFEIIQTTLVEGESVYFSDKTEGAKTWEWDFGDNSAVDTRKDPEHVYQQAGEYTVLLSVNGCEKESKKIKVDTKEIPVVEDIRPIGGISGPAEVRVGDVCTYKDTSTGATSWEWRFGETGVTDGTAKEVKYVFKEAGPHTVTLMINGGNSKTASYKVNVLPKKVASTGGGGDSGEPKLGKPVISNEKFMSLLKDVIEKKSKYMVFNPYMESMSIEVKVNNKTKSQIFSTYCNTLYYGDDPIKINSVVLKYNNLGYVNYAEIYQTSNQGSGSE
jgi:PKD repeat protein